MTNTSKKVTKIKTNGKLSSKVGNYAKDPYFLKKAEESKKFLEKNGFPEEWLSKK